MPVSWQMGRASPPASSAFLRIASSCFLASSFPSLSAALLSASCASTGRRVAATLIRSTTPSTNSLLADIARPPGPR